MEQSRVTLTVRSQLKDLPPGPSGKTGWPWTEESPTIPPTLADGTDWPSISVVTASYNQAPFIEETIRSVLLQGYPNLEYVIMDGGSTDGSDEIIRKYEPWLDFWFKGPDDGQAAAIDAGFQRTTGELLAWLNSDDVFEPAALQKAASHLHIRPKAALVYGNADEIRRDGSRIGRSAQVVACDRQFLLQEDNGIVQPAAFFRRADYEAVGGLDRSLHVAIDHDLWIRLAGRGPLVYVADTLARTRIYPEAKSASGSRAMFDEIRSVAERYGGHGLPRHFARWLGDVTLPRARAALRSGATAAGQELLAYTLAHAPECRSEALLAETLADEAWRRIDYTGNRVPEAVRWVSQICRGLPAEFVSPANVERRVLGLLYEALAFNSYRQRRTLEGIGYAARAIAHDGRRAANRGLWSSSVHSLLRR